MTQMLRRHLKSFLAILCLLAGVCLWLAGAFAPSPAAVRRSERGPDDAARRAAWFLRGRQSLDARPPAAHLLAALRQRARVPYAPPAPRRFVEGARLPDGAPVPSSGTWTELGPSPQNDMGFVRVSGRVTALAVDLTNDPTGNTVYAGTAYGGVWLSTNGLSASPTWTPISDATGSLAVGALALDSSTNPATVYVGTGEANNSLDSYYGVGILKGVNSGSGWKWTLVSSADGGAHPLLGLAFARILVDPVNPQILLAAGGSSTNLSSASLTSYTRGIYRSTDGGQSWSLAYTVSDAASSNYSCTDLTYDAADKVYFAAFRDHGIYKSSDQGQTWAAVGSPSPFVNASAANLTQFFYRAALAYGNGVLYALVSDSNGLPAAPNPCAQGQTTGCDTGLYESLNGGGAWAPVAAPACYSLVAQNGACVASDPLFSNGAADQGYYDMYLAIPPNTTNMLVAGGIDAWSTTNANMGTGASWSDLTQAYGLGVVHPDEHAIAFVNAATWYIGNDGGVWATSDSGGGVNAQGAASDWANLNSDMGTIQLESVTPDPVSAGVYTGGSQDNGTVVSTAAGGKLWGETWLGDGGYTAIDPSSPNHYFTENSDAGGVGNSIILRSDTAGVPGNSPGSAQACVWPSGDLSVCNPSYNVVVDTNGVAELGSFYVPYQLAPASPSVMLLGTCRVWSGPAEPTAPDAGWTPISPDLTTDDAPNGQCGGDYIQNLAAAPNDPGTIYVVTTDGQVQRSTDAFSPSPTWTNLTASPLPTNKKYPFGAIAVSPDDPNTAYVGVMGFTSGAGYGHVYMTSDGGTTWTDISGNLPDAPVNWILVDPQIPNDVYAATDAGVFAVTDGGAAGSGEVWQQLGSGLPNTAILQAQLAEPTRAVVVATHGRGAWSIAALGSPAPDFTLTSTDAVQNLASSGASATFTLGAAAQAGFAGSIALTCSSGANCAFSPASITPGQSSTLTVSGLSGLGSDSDRITVTGTSGGLTHTLNLTVAPASFSVALSPSANIVSPGSNASYTVNLTPIGAFTGTVSLSCAKAPAGAQCGFTASSLNLAGAGSSASTTLTITTTVASVPPWLYGPGRWRWPALGLMLLGMALLWWERRRWGRFAAGAALPLVLFALLLAAGCGGGGSAIPIPNQGSGTPAGTYAVTVTATSGGFSRSTTATLLVQ